MNKKHIDIELDPANREWEYDGDGNKIYKPEAGFRNKTPWEETEKSLDNQDKRQYIYYVTLKELEN